MLFFMIVVEHGRRQIKMDDKFFLGYRKIAVKPEEVLISVIFPFTAKVCILVPWTCQGTWIFEHAFLFHFIFIN